MPAREEGGFTNELSVMFDLETIFEFSTELSGTYGTIIFVTEMSAQRSASSHQYALYRS
jgi:hypothetical protein